MPTINYLPPEALQQKFAKNEDYFQNVRLWYNLIFLWLSRHLKIIRFQFVLQLFIHYPKYESHKIFILRYLKKIYVA